MNNLTEKEKMLSGELYDAGDAALVEERQRSKDLCFRNNQILPSKMKERKGIIKTLFGKTEKMFLIEQPFYCDYGYNIEIGEQTTHHKPNGSDCPLWNTRAKILSQNNSNLFFLKVEQVHARGQ